MTHFDTDTSFADPSIDLTNFDCNPLLSNVCVLENFKPFTLLLVLILKKSFKPLNATVVLLLDGLIVPNMACYKRLVNICMHKNILNG